MEKMQANTDKYILYSPDSLKYITDHMFGILDKKIEEYKRLFGVEEFRKIEICFFDDKEKFREYVYSIRGERDSLPEYADGVFDEGKIIAYIPPNIEPNTQRYFRQLRMAPHEIFHVMYFELVLKKDVTKRILWFDEGMAQQFSGEKAALDDDEDFFRRVFEKIKAETKRLPNMNELSHGNSFCNADYNGYNLSYIVAHYLKEKLSFEELQLLIRDVDKTREYGETILEEAMQYYTNKFATKKI